MAAHIMWHHQATATLPNVTAATDAFGFGRTSADESNAAYR